MGGSSHEQQQAQQVQQNTIDPDQKALLMGNYATAQANASKLDAPYNGILTAGFNPTQTQAQGVFSALGTDPSFMNTANQATSAIGGVLGGNTGQPYNPSQLSSTDLSKYMNPFQSSVIDASVNANERARQVANVANNQQATAAGAFGGSRSGVANALTNEAYDRNDQTNIANLNSANFAQAQGAASTDVAAQNAAKQFNVNSGIQDANLKLNAAGALQTANNNALNTATQQAGLLGSVGDMQQQQEQSQLSNAYQNWLTGQNMTAQEQSILNSALGLMPSQQTVTTNGNASADKSTTPGATDILGGIGSAGMGLGSMGLGFSDTAPKPLRFDPHARRWSSFRYVPDPSLLKEAA